MKTCVTMETFDTVKIVDDKHLANAYVFNRARLDSIAEKQKTHIGGCKNPTEDIVLEVFKRYFPDLESVHSIRGAMDLHSDLFKLRIEVKAKVNNVAGLDPKFAENIRRWPEDRTYMLINMIKTKYGNVANAIVGECMLIDGYNLTYSALELIVNSVYARVKSEETIYRPIQKLMFEKYGLNENSERLDQILSYLIKNEEKTDLILSCLPKPESTSTSENKNIEEETSLSKRISTSEETSLSIQDSDMETTIEIDEEQVVKSIEEAIEIVFRRRKEEIDNRFVKLEQFNNEVGCLLAESNKRLPPSEQIKNIGTRSLNPSIKAFFHSRGYNVVKWTNAGYGFTVISAFKSLTAMEGKPRNGSDGRLVRMAKEIETINLKAIDVHEIEFVNCTYKESRNDGLKFYDNLSDLLAVHLACKAECNAKPSSVGYYLNGSLVNLGSQLSVLKGKEWGYPIYKFIMKNIYENDSLDMDIQFKIVLKAIAECCENNINFYDKELTLFSGKVVRATRLFSLLYQVRYIHDSTKGSREATELALYCFNHKIELENMLRRYKKPIMQNRLNAHETNKANRSLVDCYNVNDL